MNAQMFTQSLNSCSTKMDLIPEFSQERFYYINDCLMCLDALINYTNSLLQNKYLESERYEIADIIKRKINNLEQEIDNQLWDS